MDVDWPLLFQTSQFVAPMSVSCNWLLPCRLFPEFKARSEFITRDWNVGLQLDAKISSHPVEVECPDARRSQEVRCCHICCCANIPKTDTVSDLRWFVIFQSGLRFAQNRIFSFPEYLLSLYEVLQMLSATVGEERFLKGVSLYLKKHSYGNTVTKDLWDAISEATGELWRGLMYSELSLVYRTRYSHLHGKLDYEGSSWQGDGRFSSWGMDIGWVPSAECDRNRRHYSGPSASLLGTKNIQRGRRRSHMVHPFNRDRWIKC